MAHSILTYHKKKKIALKILWYKRPREVEGKILDLDLKIGEDFISHDSSCPVLPTMD